jgi:two-component system response regulator HydG
LELEVNAGRFRRDLFYRLAVIHIELPPLCTRGDDITLLANHFLQQLPESKTPAKTFSAATMEVFKKYSWPGNIRELRNAVEHGLAMSRTDVITPRDLPASLQRTSLNVGLIDRRQAPSGSRVEAVDGAERDYLVALLRENAGNVAHSASQAGMSRQGLHKLLKKHGVDADEFRP